MDRIKEVDSEKYPQIDDRLDDLLIHQLYQTMRAFSKTLNSEIYTADVYSSEWSNFENGLKNMIIYHN